MQSVRSEYSIFISSLLTLFNIVTAKVDNTVVGVPTINCERDHIRFSVETQKPFTGKVYVKGEYANNQCVNNYMKQVTDGSESDSIGSFSYPNRYSPADYYESGKRWPLGGERPLYCPPCPQEPPTMRSVREIGSNKASLDVKLGTCNLRRDRTLSPPGIEVSLTVVVNFHQNFITKVDRAYRIKCAYVEAEKTVTTQIDVSMKPSTELLADTPNPICQYIIKDSNSNPVKTVRVGDLITHEWTCVSPVSRMILLIFPFTSHSHCNSTSAKGIYGGRDDEEVGSDWSFALLKPMEVPNHLSLTHRLTP
ncbi:hypothetical protein AB6A40_004092 [Gnathostoma spinigerum]|uniref:ZP domain-containing protein n=1 Tax=Gnathostoma spinigerum TaxID=75299 RepID=A0ABD6EK96_9BILA